MEAPYPINRPGAAADPHDNHPCFRKVWVTSLTLAMAMALKVSLALVTMTLSIK